MPNGQILAGYPDVGQHPTSGAWRQLWLQDAASAVDIGWWQPLAPFKDGSLEVTGLTTGTVELLVSNAATMPVNGFTITIAGTVNEGDEITAQLASSGLVGGSVFASYTVLGDDNADSVATALGAAIVAALSAQVAITDTYADNTQNSDIASGSIEVVVSGAAIHVYTNQPYQTLAVTTKVTGTDATTTAAVTQYNDNSGFVVSTVTENSNTVIDQPGMWVKGAVTALSSGTPTAILLVVA